MKKKTLSILLIALIVITYTPVKAFAEGEVIGSGTSGTCDWTIDEFGVLTLLGGEMDDWGAYQPWKYYAHLIREVKAEDTVTLSTYCGSMFYNCDELKSVDLSKFDTSNVIYMQGMFEDCKSLTSLDLRSFDTSNVQYMANMFAGCTSLTSVDVSSFDLSNVKYMEDLFAGCESLTNIDVSNFDVSNVYYIYGMFDGCKSLKSIDISNFNISNVGAIRTLFKGCESLTSIDLSNFDTSNQRFLDDLFCDCKSLTSIDVSNFDTSNAEQLLSMFKGCESLTSIDVSNFDTSKVTAMSYMFADCKSLTSLDLVNFDISNVTHMDHMFSGCESLTSIDLSSFNISNVIYAGDMFKDCSSLTTLKLGTWSYNKDLDSKPQFPRAMRDISTNITYAAGDDIPEVKNHTFVASETGDVISDLAYLAMADMAYLNVDKKNLVGAGVMGANTLYKLGSTKPDSDITMWDEYTVNNINKEYGLTWGDLYKQCLQGWEIIDCKRDDSTGFFVVTFKKDNHVVVSYRGSDRADRWNNIVTDWLKDDNYSAFVKQASPQMQEAIEYARKIKKEYNKYIGFDLSFTGHSLGGGLAILASMATGEKAVPFDSAPTVEVGYFVLSEIMAQNFYGIDKWNFIDTVNEFCPVGNYETGILYGVKQWNPKKNYVARQNMYTGGYNSIKDLVVPHSRESILTFDEEKMQFALSAATSSKKFGAKDSYAVEARQVDFWTKLLSGSVVGAIKYLAVPKGNLRLGTSLSDRKVTTTNGFKPQSDVVYGGDGDDKLGTFESSDTLIGGPGDDILDGGSGNDTYVYYLGDGCDLISDYSGNDTLELVGFSSGTLIAVDDKDENYFEVREDGYTIINIAKNRSSNPFNSFEIKILDADGNEVQKSVKIQDFNSWKKYKTFRIACPVSVEILDPNGQVVNTISDGTESMLYTEYANMYCALNEETGEYEKYVILMDGYTIRIIGEGDGEMDLSVRECETGKEDVLYSAQDLPVSTSSVYTVDTESHSVSSDDGDIYSLHEEKEEHSFSYYVSNGDATCLKDGTKTAICDSCDATDTIPDEGSAKGHAWSAWKVTKMATVFAKGVKTSTCSRCGEKKNASIAKLQPTIKLIPKSKKLKKGKTLKLKVTNLAKGDSIKSFKSSKKKVATVSKKGVVKAKKKGKAVITVKLQSGKKAKCTIIVK